MPHPPIRSTLLSSALWAVLAFGPGTAHADNPFDTRLEGLASQASRAGRAPRGVVPLLEMWRQHDFATPGLTLRLLQRLSSDRRITPARRAYAGALLARALTRSGDLDGSARTIDELGYVTDFRVIGPFDNEGKRGFDLEMPPEQSRLAPWDPDARFPGRERPVTWREYPEASLFGYVNFDAVFRPNENACGFAETFVQSDRARALSLWVGNGGAVKVWWNGEEVINDPTYRQPDPDRHAAIVSARQGSNRLLVKLCVAETTWGLYLRIGDAQGAPVAGWSADATEYRQVTAGSAAQPSSTLRTDLAALEAAAAGPSASAQALDDLARFLAYTGADDPVERRAKQLAARAAEQSPTVDRLLLAAALADERGELMRLADRARRLFPADPDVTLLTAQVRSTGPSPVDALPLLARLPDSGRAALRGMLLRAALLRDAELPEAAARIAEQAAAMTPGTTAVIEEQAAAYEAAGHADRVIELRRAALEARHDDTSSRRVLVSDALRRGDTEAVLRHLGILDRLMPTSTTSLLFAATVYEGLGRTDEALASFSRARALCPEDASVIAQHGQLLLRLGQADAGAAALREALALRPQDAETRELLEQIRPERRLDEAFAVAPRTLLARRAEQSGFPGTVLQELTVNTVFDNGLGSSFRQIAVQVHDDEGARAWRTHSIQFDPDTQRVDVRQARVFRADGRVLEATQTFEQPLGEPWYRIYYDTRALVVVFPDLEPGDVVEVQYRTDDIAHRNVFADYYGDLHVLQGFVPTRRMDYVLVTPASRRFYFNEPALPGLRHEHRVEDGRRIDHFFAADVPAIRGEESMPGMTEIAPYLHVSTYRTWEDVGHWWWGLIRDQLQLDDNLRRIVRDLVEGAPDLRTKVQRIHDWVVRNTRYVGLEFGIHGYMPYRMPLVVQRGFGDCKDKASLMYSMFREAGIDARIVLVRTRRNGAIGDLPASLAVFDHAIAYVPELDLYLDGTAEQSGTTELPTMDQGVTVLVVGPDDARLTRTPVMPASASHRQRVLEARLSDDGSAEIRVEEEIRGADAAGYRSTYQSEGTRAERFERALRQIFPGSVLESQTMERLDDLESPVRLQYRARVPQFARRDGDTLRAAPSVLDDLLRNLARTPTRRHALDVGGTRSYDEQRVIVPPPGYRVSRLPEAGRAESTFGQLRLDVESADGQVETRTHFELARDRIAPNEYGAFRRWVEDADRLLRQQIRIERGQP